MSAQHNRNSPHLSNHLHNGSNPPSPSMSNAQQQGGPSRQGVSYPSPTSYPSPSMSNAQYNYPPPNSQQNEPYRASPTGSNGSMSLPSMRSLDPLQQQQQQQVQHHMGSPLPPPVAQMGGGPYYQGGQLPHPGHVYPNVTSDPNGQNMRYALPVTESRVMSGGRHKKEIKRRTKTGCLTCRKRRIKCDEGHPACRNCQKSKRECLGYDPIFKNNPGPQTIQPAPSAAPQQPTQTVTSGANPYGQQPPMAGYGAPPPNMAYDPALTGGVSSPGAAAPQYDYASAIDPALEAAAPPPTALSANQFAQSTPGKLATFSSLTDGMSSAYPCSTSSNTLHLRGGASAFDSPFIVATPQEHMTYTTSSAKRWSIDELLALGGAAPASLNTEASQSPDVIEEAKHLYYSIYSPGLESFLESKWFQLKGAAQLLIDGSVIDKFNALLQQFAKTNQNDPTEMIYTGSVEARVIWALACMVRAPAEAAIKADPKPDVPAADDPVEASLRLDVFQALLTGNVAPGNALTKPVQTGDSIRQREMEFWYALGDFVAIDYETAIHAKQIDDTLGNLRNLLDGRENRDVLYSIAVVRAIGHRVSEYTDSDTPQHLDESDNRSKLHVAKKFVVDEANGGGTTNVIRKLCELAARAWRR
ncbi:hypothetical protein BP6252_09910 [Coleophoma cylindrospora]|uniref:Zn(2)-C6 fungal-type domain-containing protein n=1 Tax=Coleophoma cylindrospora TaxID=1849047 RepID=A0A3D8QWY7_9HELO|nr:hypothetical protein BP6252_09910 [Coleophoma cylindrospora]